VEPGAFWKKRGKVTFLFGPNNFWRQPGFSIGFFKTPKNFFSGFISKNLFFPGQYLIFAGAGGLEKVLITPRVNFPPGFNSCKGCVCKSALSLTLRGGDSI